MSQSIMSLLLSQPWPHLTTSSLLYHFHALQVEAQSWGLRVGKRLSGCVLAREVLRIRKHTNHVLKSLAYCAFCIQYKL